MSELATNAESSICERHFFWLPGQKNSVFCCLHLPLSHHVNNHLVIVCNPIGYEYSHAHRTLRHLCDSLAAKGIAAVRFDYHGTGDSPGTILDSERLETFQNNINDVIKHVSSFFDNPKITLLGLRLGSTIAGLYASKFQVDNLVFWSPCERGRAFVREMRALDRLSEQTESIERDYIDSAGFLLSNDTADELSQINLRELNYKVAERVLLVDRDDISPGSKFYESLLKTTSYVTSQFVMDGYTEMMSEPQETLVPTGTLNRIVDWCTEVPTKTIQKPVIEFQSELAIESNDLEIKETIVKLGSNQLCAIISKPAEKVSDSLPTVVLANSGAVHRVGPNRIYVELARKLASIGFQVIRVDLRNLGDSVSGYPDNENSPYPAESTEDIQSVLDTLKVETGAKDFVIAGLCSGAHNVFHTALEVEDTSNIREVIMINPLAFYRRPHLYIDNSKEQSRAKNTEQYKNSLLSIEKWKKLIKADVDMKYLLKFIFNFFILKSKNLVKSILEKFGFVEPSQLSRDFQKLKSKNIKLAFFIASKDPGESIIMSQAKGEVLKLMKSGDVYIERIPDSDHTFSSKLCRDNFISIISSYLESRYKYEK